MVVRWNNPGILEVRIPLTESKRRRKQYLEKTWLMIAPAFPPREYAPWKLTKARGNMIAEQKTQEKVYHLSHTRVEDEDHNVGTFECHDPQGHLFAEKRMVESVKSLIDGGECVNLRVHWHTGNNPYPSRELSTLIGHGESNEIVVGGSDDDAGADMLFANPANLPCHFSLRVADEVGNDVGIQKVAH